ncbi:hypothetical protein LJ753_16750 [Arthrobacter sp. zg-Y20]|uniref:hypothetical protein n=1 Tax=unclassified Arthrobacter TaxID=235627 RepID=UPI001D14AB53|nr:MULTISPECIES: hypothetical protein [unclassified Arthrobacter]MCC3277515.1 hypothetical protein [Arthrobacter sp. zg-Y20]MDK1317675.1 hypothetical protein [Arthrobacter sp. zg.Y20]WIB07066.1 hypothetical protein QNO06_04880 [Arthrobacter sp. zg-Y20]
MSTLGAIQPPWWRTLMALDKAPANVLAIDKNGQSWQQAAEAGSINPEDVKWQRSEGEGSPITSLTLAQLGPITILNAPVAA